MVQTLSWLLMVFSGAQRCDCLWSPGVRVGCNFSSWNNSFLCALTTRLINYYLKLKFSNLSFSIILTNSLARFEINKKGKIPEALVDTGATLSVLNHSQQSCLFSQNMVEVSDQPVTILKWGLVPSNRGMLQGNMHFYQSNQPQFTWLKEIFLKSMMPT